MKTDTTILAFQHPDEIDDPLTSVLHEGARRLLAQAIEAEAESFLAAMQGERLADGRARVVRHGHGPERAIQTGIGAVPVRRAKLRDRGAGEAGGERITFTSAPSAEMGAADQEPRCSAAGSLSARHLDRRLSGGAGGAPRQGRAEPVAIGDRAPEGGVAGRLRPLAAPRALGQALRLHLGRWGLSSGPHGG